MSLGLIAAILIFPPAGLILLWMRPARVWAKLLGSLAICLIGIAELFAIYGLRIELDGTGRPKFFHFGKRDSHYARIEESRAQQQSLPTPTPQPAAAPASDPAPAASPETAKPSAPKSTAPAPYWTDFRGPRRDGVYDQTSILTHWPKEGLKPLWKQPVGGGYASFVIADGRAFTIEQRRAREFVTAYDVLTGRELWNHSYDANFQETMGGDGPRATPTYHAGLLYSLGATGELRCLDAANGALKWSKNILKDNDAQNLQWGMSASPLIVDDKLIVQPGGAAGKSIVAYNKLTGDPIWKSLDDVQAYTSPMLVTLSGKRQILTVTAKRAIGITPEEGKLLWEFPWVTEYDVNSAQPIVVDESHVLLSAGYGHGAALLEISPSGQVKTVWQNTKMKNKFNSSVLVNGYLYGLDESIFACIDVRTGEQKWKAGRYGYGQLLLAHDRIILTTETGDVVLIRPNPERLEELARFSALDGKTWNVPALADGRLFVRNTTEMAAYRVAP